MPAVCCRLGDWFKVEKLIKETGGDDSLLVNAWNKIGEVRGEAKHHPTEGGSSQRYERGNCCVTKARLSHSCTPALS